MTTQTADHPLWISVLGQAEGGQEAEVRAQVSGTLKEVLFAEGQPVKKGEILYKIDPEPFEAKLRSARAKRARAEADLQQANRELIRTEKLYKIGAKSQKAYDDARSDRAVAAATLDSARADEKDAAISLKWTRVAAPADGFTAKTRVNPGALIQQQSTLLTSVTQHDDVRVVFSPSDRMLSGYRITPANRVEIRTEDGRVLPAKLDFVSQSVTPSTSTVTMRARVNKDAGILPGAFVKVRLMIGERLGAVLVPQKAVRQEPDGSYLVFVHQEGKAVARTVLVDRWDGPNWIVTSGLKSGEEVITNQMIKLQDGLTVQIANKP